MPALERHDATLERPGGRRVGFRLRGAADGPLLLFEHATPGSRLDAELFTDAELARRGLGVLSVDRPGYGRSDPLRGAGVVDCVADRLAVLDELGVGRVAAASVAGGARYALELAAAAPERVDALLLIAGCGPLDRPGATAAMTPEAQEEIALARSSPGVLRQRLAAVIEAVLDDPWAALSAQADSYPPEDRVLFDDPAAQPALVATLREAVRHGPAGWLEDDLRRVSPWPLELAAVTMPALLFHGRLDEWEPLSTLEPVLRALPDPRLTTYAGGHFSPWAHVGEMLDAVAAVLAER